ncbi:hypothetical protein MPTK1_5g13590 [Marchantia polymorpha subsp. ruderalis]|uniref:Uncharacterized protein n=2 Tax=Marchantia polymorpha TaxID=3197 RepID=A0AAF6BI08_MARPO|nr:hypothetical protein MARPO_0032s0052 [Marchantia polymorpha]BBN11642.1 hypothetical protein Mp_5g13590 [Marchantia polymorpha subsp. ruderalis]|eukprot:PTQ41856.1 hypothetical protein MARPO_0032s0052 [Marchantia polymorpha]
MGSLNSLNHSSASFTFGEDWLMDAKSNGHGLGKPKRYLRPRGIIVVCSNNHEKSCSWCWKLLLRRILSPTTLDSNLFNLQRLILQHLSKMALQIHHSYSFSHRERILWQIC